MQGCGEVTKQSICVGCEDDVHYVIPHRALQHCSLTGQTSVSVQYQLLSSMALHARSTPFTPNPL